jgi:tetratricopeptide (TPR) repeat protein
LGNAQKALEYYDKALVIRLQVYGEHSDMARSYDNLGSAHGRLGNAQKALEYYEKALAIRLQAHGKAHPDVARSYVGLGGSYFHQGNIDKAIELWESIRDSSHTSSSLHNLACAYHVRSRQRVDERDWLLAKQRFEKAIQMQAEASTYCEYAQFLYLRGLEQHKEDWFEQAIIPLMRILRTEQKGGLVYSLVERETVLPALRELLNTPEDTFELRPLLLARYLLVSCYCHLNRQLEAQTAMDELQQLVHDQPATVVSSRLWVAAQKEYAALSLSSSNTHILLSLPDLIPSVTSNSSSLPSSQPPVTSATNRAAEEKGASVEFSQEDEEQELARALAFSLPPESSGNQQTFPSGPTHVTQSHANFFSARPIAPAPSVSAGAIAERKPSQESSDDEASLAAAIALSLQSATQDEEQAEEQYDRPP